MAMSHYAHGATFFDTGAACGVGTSTMCKYFWEFVDAMVEVNDEKIRWLT